MNALLRALAVLVLTASPNGQDTPAVSGRLTLDVVAVGHDGAPVVDLKPQEFEVWVSGYRVPVDEVAFVTPESAPRTLVLLLDNAAIGPQLAIRVREAASAFVKRLGPADRVTIVPVHGTPVAGTGAEPARLLQAIDEYQTQGFPLHMEDASEHVLRLFATISRQMVEIPGRKAIVAIGAVWLFDTPLPPPGLRDLHAEWLNAMRSMAAANASL